LSTPDVLYFDFPYEADPIEPGYYWGSRSTDS
jgi:hexosaminidase